MTTAEIASKYGVPMPETCKELGWQRETNFYWLKLKDNNDYLELGFCLSLPDTENKKFRVLGENVRFDIDDFYYDSFIPAPQFHEIWKFLPPKIGTKQNITTLLVSNNAIFYVDKDINPIYWVQIYQNNIAQAAAELYFKIKSKKIL